MNKNWPLKYQYAPHHRHSPSREPLQGLFLDLPRGARIYPMQNRHEAPTPDNPCRKWVFFSTNFFSLQNIVSCIRLEFPSGNVGAPLDKSNLSESRERKNLSWLRCQEIDRILPQMCLHSESGTFTPLRAPTRHYQRGISGLVWRLEDLQVALEMYKKLTVKCGVSLLKFLKRIFFSRDESKLIGIVDDRCAMLTI